MKLIVASLAVLFIATGCSSSDNDNVIDNPIGNVDANNALIIPEGTYKELCFDRGDGTSTNQFHEVSGPNSQLQYTINTYEDVIYNSSDCSGAQVSSEEVFTFTVFISGEKNDDTTSFMYFPEVNGEPSFYEAYALIGNTLYISDDIHPDGSNLDTSDFDPFYSDPANYFSLGVTATRD